MYILMSSIALYTHITLSHLKYRKYMVCDIINMVKSSSIIFPAKNSDFDSLSWKSRSPVKML